MATVKILLSSWNSQEDGPAVQKQASSRLDLLQNTGSLQYVQQDAGDPVDVCGGENSAAPLWTVELKAAWWKTKLFVVSICVTDTSAETLLL